jgi:hypothetical protein
MSWRGNGFSMNTKEAIMAFSQSEKIKAGLIWAAQTLEISQGVSEEERRGSEKMITALLHMIGHEISLARRLAPHDTWQAVEPPIQKALTMIQSGVGLEAVTHLSKALSSVTNIGQQSMSLLKQEGLL